MTVGIMTFIFAGCCLESPEPYSYLMLAMALAGMIMTYLGYRMDDIGRFLNCICRRAEKCFQGVALYCSNVKQWKDRKRKKHWKVKQWLGRAQRNFQRKE